jgi:hypothetical protein
MLKDIQATCVRCGVYIGALHVSGCDMECCPRCGGQAISCGCIHDAEWGSLRMHWTGIEPGVEACRELGWYSKLVPGKGWLQCDQTDKGAREDLNRLVMECRWDQERQKFVAPFIASRTLSPYGDGASL